MTVFVDTSAFYAVLDRNDINHTRAATVWQDLLSGEPDLLTNNYVLLETSALLQSHLGLPAMQIFQQDVVPLLTVDWITDNRHQAGVDAALTAGRRKLSLVDCISFQTMRKYSLESAFCFDKHFREQGFNTLP